MSRSPPPIDIERAQASQPLGQPNSGRRSARIAGDSVPAPAWGHNPEAAARGRQNQGGITSFISSVISPVAREDRLPTHEPSAGQAPYTSAAPVRNTQPPPPPQQPRGSTSVPPATAASTSSAPERAQQLSSGPSSSPPASQPQEPVGEPNTSSSTAPQATTSSASTSSAPERSQQPSSGPSSSPPASQPQEPVGESNTSSSAAPQRGATTSSASTSLPLSLAANAGSLETRSQPPSLGDRTAIQSPNMSQQSQSNTGTRVRHLQEVTGRWEEALGDWNKVPSELGLGLLQDLFRVALRTSERRHYPAPNCGSCHREMTNNTQNQYVRCGHAMHLNCITQGGLDGGCPVCPTQLSFLRPPDETDDTNYDMDCQFCISTLTSKDQLRVLPCAHAVHADCIPRGALAHGCPFCREYVLTYGFWREIDSPQSSVDGLNPPSGQINGDILIFGGPWVASPTSVENTPQPQEEEARGPRNEERDRLLSELFHIHPDLWHLFMEERRRLQEIQNEANFDLDGWLNDFRAYHTGPGSDMRSILTRWQFSEHDLDLDIQDPQNRGVAVGPHAVTFYNAIRTTINSLMNGIDEVRAKLAFMRANRTRPRHSGNAFHANFWLPHERMRRRANTDRDQQSVRLHMGRYIRTFHNHPIMAALSQEYNMNGEPGGNGTVQENDREWQPNGGNNNREQQVDNGGEIRRSAEARLGPRAGWVYDGETEKEIRGYREIGNGYQLLLKTPAPITGFWDHELVASHLFGGEVTVNAYKQACAARGEPEFIFGESSLDLLKTKTRSQVRILSRSVFRRYDSPPDGCLNAPMQHLEIKFTDEEEIFWYTKSNLERQFTRAFVVSLLNGLYAASGLSPVPFIPSQTRQRASRSRNANTVPGGQAPPFNPAVQQPNIPTVPGGQAWPFNPAVQQPNIPTVPGGQAWPFNPVVQQPNIPTVPGGQAWPPNPVVQQPNIPTVPGGQAPPFNPAVQQPNIPTTLVSLEARFTRLEQMITQLLAGGGRIPTPESVTG